MYESFSLVNTRLEDSLQEKPVYRISLKTKEVIKCLQRSKFDCYRTVIMDIKTNSRSSEADISVHLEIPLHIEKKKLYVFYWL